MPLYVIATPIGNLADITLRALEILKTCDYILCEDTRHSSILLNHYQISKPLKSYHKFNEAERSSEVIQGLKEGLSIGLITDAGTPAISDPGSYLVKACHENQVEVIALPGPCAAIQALAMTGWEFSCFQFCGFLPKKAMEKEKFLKDLLSYSGVSICYESPERIFKTIEAIVALDSNRKIAIARELTKKFEQYLEGTALELQQHFSQNTPRGEFVLLISPCTVVNNYWEKLSLQEHVEYLQSTKNLSVDEAIRTAAKERAISKRIVYQAIHHPT
ncbi:MAG: hypothetical protein K0S74_1800 [Chlamydiales bacterium]|nr:hypothetical protein [Chlamydiales bacterium]